MTDIVGQFQRASWREIEFPVSGREYGFTQEHAPHRFIFRDDKLIESLGRENPTYRYTIPFREDIAVGPWVNLFTVVYPEFLRACVDRSRGVLTDPLHGSTKGKCVSLRELLDVNKRDGIDVEAEFIYAPEQSDLNADLGSIIRTLEGARTSAGAFDAEVQKVNFEQRQPPEPSINPLDLIGTIGSQVEVAGNQFNASLEDAAFRLEKSNDAIEALKNPNLQPLQQRSRRLQMALVDLEDKTDPTGVHPVRRTTSTVQRTVAATAALLGMTIQELIRLNPQFARGPLILAGTTIKAFGDQERQNARL